MKCFDETGKKIGWKMLELIKREEQIIGREGEEVEQKIEKQDQNGPTPMHMSYFPELSYAVLRSSSW